MTRFRLEETALGLLALLGAAVAPNIFPAAQAGLASMAVLGGYLLVPSIGMLVAVVILPAVRGHRGLARRILAGAGAGALATLGLEAVRITSFHLGGMPGDLPRLLGVLLTDRFMDGPPTLSDVVGYAYHFWNGACFGVIFAIAFGRASWRWTLVYGVALGIGFLASPAPQALGVGFLALQMPSMLITVVLAHVVFGLIFGMLIERCLPKPGGLFSRNVVSVT